MRTPRIYTPQALTTDTEATLEPAASRHLVQVLRLRSGDNLTLFNGNGFDYSAVLLNADKRNCRVLVGSTGNEEPLPSLNIEIMRRRHC